jgi:hypothetical protein
MALDVDTVASCLNSLYSILRICANRPNVRPIAERRLSELLATVDISKEVSIPAGSSNRSFKHDTQVHRNQREQSGQLCPPLKSKLLKEFAPSLSRQFRVPLDSGVLKRKPRLEQWYEENWAILREGFFRLWDAADPNKPSSE